MAQDLGCPLPRAHVEIAGAGGIAVFARAPSGQPVVEVVVGQQDMGDACEQRGVLLLHPQQLGNRVARRDDDTEALQGTLFTAQPVEQALILRSRLRVAPELGRAQDAARGIERDQAMLLPGDTNAQHGAAVDPGLGQSCRGSAGESGGPLPGVLLAPAVGPADQIVAGRALAEHASAAGVEQQRLGALGTAIDPEKHAGSLTASATDQGCRSPPACAAAAGCARRHRGRRANAESACRRFPRAPAGVR